MTSLGGLCICGRRQTIMATVAKEEEETARDLLRDQSGELVPAEGAKETVRR